MKKNNHKDPYKEFFKQLSYDSKEEVCAADGKSLSIRSCEIKNENYPGDLDTPFYFIGMAIGRVGPESIKVDIENVKKLNREINRFLKWHQKYHEHKEAT